MTPRIVYIKTAWTLHCLHGRRSGLPVFVLYSGFLDSQRCLYNSNLDFPHCLYSGNLGSQHCLNNSSLQYTPRIVYPTAVWTPCLHCLYRSNLAHFLILQKSGLSTLFIQQQSMLPALFIQQPSILLAVFIQQSGLPACII
jgi:hypothetical protein